MGHEKQVATVVRHRRVGERRLTAKFTTTEQRQSAEQHARNLSSRKQRKRRRALLKAARFPPDAQVAVAMQIDIWNQKSVQEVSKQTFSTLNFTARKSPFSEGCSREESNLKPSDS